MNCMKGACCTLLSLLFSLTVSSGCKEKDMSMKMNEPHNIKGVISYKRSFGDLNDTHLSVAEENRNSSVGFSFGSRGAGWQIGSDKTL